jgi:HEPN domain-containing protein
MTDSAPDAEPSEAHRWFRLAEEDLAAAEVLLEDQSTALRIVGFLAQQAAEKALKAGLIHHSVSVPRIHGLRQLCSRFPTSQGNDFDADDLDLLDPWVIDGRYAADLPDVEFGTASELLAAARRVLEIVRSLIK